MARQISLPLAPSPAGGLVTLKRRQKTHAFFRLNRDKMSKAMEFFSKHHGIPVVDDPAELGTYDVVLFSVLSFRDFWRVAEVAKYKRDGQEWIAGGNAATNPTGIVWAMDWIFVGDAFLSFRAILDGEREMPGMLDCRGLEYGSHAGAVTYNVEPIFHEAIGKNEMILSKGCPRRCLFCVNAFRTPYQEQDKEAVRKFIESYKGKGVYLSSNSSDDVSYYADVGRMLAATGKLDMAVSNAIQGIDDEFLETKKTELLIGVEGMSERIRRVINKPIRREKLDETLDRAFRRGVQVRTVMQFNLPGEDIDDWHEFEETVAKVLERHSSGSWAIPFIPNQPSSMTPMQWCRWKYSVEQVDRIMAFRRSMFGSKDRGVSVYVPAPLYPGKWFRQVITEWVPVTPELDAVLKRARPKERPEYYVELVRPVVGDLSFLLSDLPEDFAFPWDNVEIATPKAKLLRFYRTMRKRMARLNCVS